MIATSAAVSDARNGGLSRLRLNVSACGHLISSNGGASSGGASDDGANPNDGGASPSDGGGPSPDVAPAPSPDVVHAHDHVPVRAPSPLRASGVPPHRPW